MIRLIIVQADIESSTPISDQIIHVFAFFTFSSSHPDTRYIIPLIISTITANTATYCIRSHIKCTIASIGPSVWLSHVHHDSQPGNHAQFISGAAASTGVTETIERNIKLKSFFIIFMINKVSKKLASLGIKHLKLQREI